MRSVRSKRALICIVVLVTLAGICTPGVRAFARAVAAELSHGGGPHSASLRQAGPIPYILDLNKRKHPRPAAAPAKASAKKAAKDVGSAPAPAAEHKEDLALPQPH
jgi:hypothetical protein